MKARLSTVFSPVLISLGLVALGLLASSCALTWEKSGYLRCTEDDQCEAGEKCLLLSDELGEGRCVTENVCNDRGDCKEGEVCRSYTCVEPSCRDDGECFPFRCDVENGACYEECADEGDFRCSDDAGVSCRDSRCVHDDCGGEPAEVCDGFACRGETCLSYCSEDAECAAGYRCSLGECTNLTAAGGICAGDDECESGVCLGGGCAASCAEMNYECGPFAGQNCGECADDQFCAGNVCSWKRPEGNDCDIDAQCVSDFCHNAYLVCSEKLEAGDFCAEDGDCESNACCYDGWELRCGSSEC